MPQHNTLVSLINLDSLLDLSARLNESNDEDFILNAMLLSAMGKLRVFRACVLMPDMQNDPQQLISAVFKGKALTIAIPLWTFHSFISLADYSQQPGASLLMEAGYQYAVPLKSSDTLLGILCLGPTLSGRLTEEEQYYASLVSAIAANALQNARSQQSLLREKNTVEKQNQLLSTLFEMSREFSALLSKEQILKLSGYQLMGQMMISRYAIIQKKTDGNAEILVNRLGCAIPPEISKELMEEMKSPSVSEYITPHQNTAHWFAEAGIQVVSLMKAQGSVKGLLVIGRKLHGGSYSAEDLRFIEALGNTTMVALENDRLFHEELRKKQLESEMSVARDIQNRLFPASIPQMPGMQICARSYPSKQVGGDYYDCIRLSADEILIAIADVSGKGMPAALLMANVQAALRVLVPSGLSLPELIGRLNSLVYQNTGADKFVTFFCGIINIHQRTLSYINAGHNPPYARNHDGTITELSTGGIILGILPDPPPYVTGYLDLSNVEALLLYTDGVSEAMNTEGEEWGEENLQKLFIAADKNSADNLAAQIMQAVQEHAGNAPQSDDITLIALICCHT
jgi:sigma-B regulation protein RsbU (phosphoserine phosphatase)